MDPIKPQVTATTATTVSLSWSLPGMDQQSSTPYYGINCSSSSSSFSIEELAADQEFILSRSQCTYYTVENSTSSLRVAGLMPASSYMCCVEDSHGNAQGCVDVQTLEGIVHEGGVSGAVAGVIGGIIGALLVVIILSIVAAIIVGVLYYRKKQLTRVMSKPLARVQSKRYSHATSESTSLERKVSMKTGETATLRNNAAKQPLEEQDDTIDITEQDSSANNQEEDLGPLYASTSIPAITLRQILPGGEGPARLLDMTESFEEPEHYESMLPLGGPSPVYKNLPKGMSPGDIYINYPNRHPS